MIGTMEIIIDKAVDELNFEVFAKKWIEGVEETYSKLGIDCEVIRNGNYAMFIDKFTGIPFASGIDLRHFYYESMM